MAAEAELERYFVSEVKRLGGRQRKVKWIAHAGAPDRVVWWPGPFMAFVELKRPGKGAEPHQAREHDRLRADGFRVYVIDSKEALDVLFTDLRTRSLNHGG